MGRFWSVWHFTPADDTSGLAIIELIFVLLFVLSTEMLGVDEGDFEGRLFEEKPVDFATSGQAFLF